MKVIDYGILKFESTGKEIEANRGIIGIDGDLDVFEGYDDGLRDGDFTREERIELADYMIALWSKFKEKAAG